MIEKLTWSHVIDVETSEEQKNPALNGWKKAYCGAVLRPHDKAFTCIGHALTAISMGYSDRICPDCFKLINTECPPDDGLQRIASIEVYPDKWVLIHADGTRTEIPPNTLKGTFVESPPPIINPKTKADK